jgi:hypothetical protein
MNPREPPKLAVWLLRRWASPYQREALLGDLVELYRAGHSQAWYWRQTLVALTLARVRTLRTLAGSNLHAALLRILNALLAAALLALAAGSLTEADTARIETHGTQIR